MNKKLSFFLQDLHILFVCLLLSMAACQAERAVVAQETPNRASELEQDIHSLVNAHRSTLGLGPFSYSEEVAGVARQHSQAMATGRSNFSHAGADKRQQVLARKIAFRRFAENIAMNTYRSDVAGKKAFDDWLTSSGHRAAIEGNFNQTGIGVAQDSAGAFYFTQIFVLAQ
jgi:uncharacterized protein YkwD